MQLHRVKHQPRPLGAMATRRHSFAPKLIAMFEAPLPVVQSAETTIPVIATHKNGRIGANRGNRNHGAQHQRCRCSPGHSTALWRQDALVGRQPHDSLNSGAPQYRRTVVVSLNAGSDMSWIILYLSSGVCSFSSSFTISLFKVKNADHLSIHVPLVSTSCGLGSRRGVLFSSWRRLETAS
jgi:hypothetical protein